MKRSPAVLPDETPRKQTDSYGDVDGGRVATPPIVRSLPCCTAVPAHDRRRPLRLGGPLVVAILALDRMRQRSKSSSTTAAAAATHRCRPSTTTAGAPASAPGTAPGELTSLTIGYSAWPGWFPLAVADKEGIFAEAGLNVDLKYFADYTASLDALVAGQVDVNAQTLNDTIFAVASGSEQKIVVTGDNSTGNDAVICDESITSIEDLKGKTVAAEAGVVDHFLLLQGLATKGMTEEDINFQGVKTDAAAAAFAGGQFDCVAVFAPFTVQALERPGLARAVQLEGLPRRHPRPPRGHRRRRPTDTVAMQKLVDAWYTTLDYIKANPDEATKIMADQAGVSVAEYQSLADGHHALRRRPGAQRLRGPAGRPDLAARDGPPDQPVPRQLRPGQEAGRPRAASSSPQFTEGLRRRRRR